MASFGIYLHVPFCSSRCGYCDFNTYTPGELGSANSQATYLGAIVTELALAVATTPDPQPAQTVFVGGGTPSLLGAAGLARLLDAVRDTFGLAPGAEVTTEANPESTSPEFFAAIREAGYTRVSLGMQSVSPHVLAILERRHNPARALAAAQEARAAGFDHVNLDMIYGTPGESDADVADTLAAILAAGVDHVSAYSLIVEDGTALARRVRRGELPAPDEDVLARRYEQIDQALRGAGMSWYEVSNWAMAGGECRHNLGYWQGGSWWGAGPGAHSTLGTHRFVNLKHPARYAAAVARGELPIAEREELTRAEQHTEEVMLGLRLREGIPLAWVNASAVTRLVHEGMLIVDHERVRVSDRGRLFVDGIVTDLLLAEELA